jgi:signal transduction histidine kinase/HPt (histidine-containing phosphotransfer) domain-containing protein/ActR/RegA family two-component response regulator
MMSPGIPFAGSALLEQSWRLRYHDQDESVRLARAALDAVAGEPRGTIATWARFTIATGRISRGPNAGLLAEVDDIRVAFHELGDHAGEVLTIAARAALDSMQGGGQAAWRSLVEDVEPHLPGLSAQFQFVGAVYFTVAALGTKDLQSGLRHAHRALELARQFSDPGPLALALFNLGYLHLNHGSFQEASERFSEVMSLAGEHDLANRRRTTPPSLIVAHVALGRFEGAEALSEQWMAEFAHYPLDNHVIYGRVMAIYLAARHPERWPQAEAWLAELESEFAARERGEGLGMAQAYVLHVAWAKAALLRAQGRHEEAIAALQAAEPYDALCQVTFIHMVVKEELQRACAALGRWQEAHAAMIEFARRQANLLTGANAVRLHTLAIQHAVDRERLARQKAEESARLKSEFLANVSHELRTPMNAIIGMAHLALATPLAPNARDYVEKIHRAGQTLLGLINDILDFSKIEAAKLELHPEDFDLDELIGNVEIVAGHDAAEKSLAWKVEVADGVPRRLHGDPLRLGQVLINLVNNALKFTEPGGAVTLSIALPPPAPPGERPARLHFEVRDTGIGLSDEQQARLFQPFVQADGSTSRRYGGTGLGLSISRRLVELMGGGIGVRSTLGQGASFFFDVPLVAAVAPAERGSAAASGRSRAPAHALGEAFAGRRVLLVEDNAVNRQVAGELLAGVGVEVDMAEDGARALALLGAAPPTHYDLVLMDLQMPRLDGHDTTAAIRADARFDSLPIVALTAHAEPALRARCAAQGMEDFVSKPIVPEELWRVAARWMRPSAAPSAPAAVPAAAPRAGDAGPDDAAGAPRVAGLDVHGAIRALGGSASLYREVLKRFAQAQADFAAELQRCRAEGRHVDAMRLVHTLKGLAGTIGAAELGRHAAEFETRLRGSTAPWPDPAPLTRSLHGVLAAIAAAG